MRLFTCTRSSTARQTDVHRITIIIKQSKETNTSSTQHNWLSSIRTRKQPFSSVDLGTKVMVIVDLATRSIWDGRAYSFDPETMTASRA